jgi:ribosomal protein S18 acetylase RimI-like enzyme
MIRPSVPADTAALVQVARQTGAFSPEEIQDLHDRLDAYPDRHTGDDHQALTCEHDGRPLGLAYYAPVAMADRTWSLYWLVVTDAPPGPQAADQLLRHTEQDVRGRGGRLLVFEASSRSAQESLRRLLAAHGYQPGAVLPDFYADGEDQIIFRKRLTP